MRQALRCLVLLATACFCATPALAQDQTPSPPPVIKPTPSNQSDVPAPNAPEEAVKKTACEQNAQEGSQWPSPLRFDTKGVEFGPWARRFLAQVKRNWKPNIPLFQAMLLRGPTVMTFNVHKDGSLTDVAVAVPSGIGGFDTAARQALLMSNPTSPLPFEYPDEKACMTLTFRYDESPPSTGAEPNDRKRGETPPP